MLIYINGNYQWSIAVSIELQNGISVVHVILHQHIHYYMNWLWSVYDPTMEGGSESIHKVSAHFSVLSNTGRGIGIGTFRSDIGLCIITLLFFEHPKFIIRCLFQHKFVGCTH